MNFDREELEMLSKDSGGTFTSATVKQLAADLLDARALLRKINSELEKMVKQLPEKHDDRPMYFLPISVKKARALYRKTKEFADE